MNVWLVKLSCGETYELEVQEGPLQSAIAEMEALLLHDETHGYLDLEVYVVSSSPKEEKSAGE